MWRHNLRCQRVAVVLHHPCATTRSCEGAGNNCWDWELRLGFFQEYCWGRMEGCELQRRKKKRSVSPCCDLQKQTGSKTNQFVQKAGWRLQVTRRDASLSVDMIFPTRHNLIDTTLAAELSTIRAPHRPEQDCISRKPTTKMVIEAVVHSCPKWNVSVALIPALVGKSTASSSQRPGYRGPMSCIHHLDRWFSHSKKCQFIFISRGVLNLDMFDDTGG